MIYVIASIEVKEGAKEEFLKIFKANVPAVKAESGCIMYQPTVDFDSGMDAQKHIPDNVVTIIEGWACVDYLAKHPDDKDSTQKELQEEQETLLEEIAALKTPLTEVQEDLKKLRDIRYWVRKATPGTEESKEPPKKQPIKEVLQDKTDEKKAQRTAPEQTKHKQQDMEL